MGKRAVAVARFVQNDVRRWNIMEENKKRKEVQLEERKIVI
jgi:hypothetical protein